MNKDINLLDFNGIQIAELTANEIIIHCTQDALDIMGNCTFNGIHKIIIHQHQLVAEFFDLKTGIAGDILQKFSTYRVQLAIVGDFSKYTSKSLRDFIMESNKHGWINFVVSVEEAMNKLTKN
jgi:hypothetical protein